MLISGQSGGGVFGNSLYVSNTFISLKLFQNKKLRRNVLLIKDFYMFLLKLPSKINLCNIFKSAHHYRAAPFLSQQ